MQVRVCALLSIGYKSDPLLHAPSTVMQTGGSILVLATQVLLLVACGQSGSVSDEVETVVRRYSLCPKTDDARERLSEQLKSFSREQQARLIDRSDGVQQELSDIKSAVLSRTGSTPMLVTVEKPGEFRISVTNLGLKEKYGLATRVWEGVRDAGPTSGFLEEVSRSWTIQEVMGGVTDDPPCS